MAHQATETRAKPRLFCYDKNMKESVEITMSKEDDRITDVSALNDPPQVFMSVYEAKDLATNYASNELVGI